MMSHYMISTQTLEKLYCAEIVADDDLNRPHGITFSALLRLVRACPKLHARGNMRRLARGGRPRTLR